MEEDALPGDTEPSIPILRHREHPEEAVASAEALPVDMREAGSSQPMDRVVPYEEDASEKEERDSVELAAEHQVPNAETAAQESCKLRTALIAKVLAEKCSLRDYF